MPALYFKYSIIYIDLTMHILSYTLLKLSRSSSCQPGGIEITTTAEINAPASFDPVIEVESNQAVNVEPISQSYSRYFR